MDWALPILAIVAVIAGWNIFLYRHSRGRAWSPLWMAFTTTAAAAIFVVAGAIGYTLDRHDRFVARTAWADGVIWWEVGVGLAIAVMAVYLWRKGLQTLQTRP